METEQQAGCTSVQTPVGDVNEVRFDKDRYHLQSDMIKWCRENIGPVKWTYGTPTEWEGLGGAVVTVNCTFGTTFFAFKNATDATAFMLVWE